MPTAKHTPPGDDSFRHSLLRSGAGAVGLVALVAVVFAGIGALGPDADVPTVASDTRDVDDDAEPPGDDDAEPPAGDEESDAAGDASAPDAEDPDEAPEPSEEPDEPESEPGDDAGEPGADDTDEGDEADGGPADRESAGDRAFAPDSVTIQVLDGYQADGGAAASSVAATLREEGYRVVAENPSLRYEVTTVLWTPGFEAQAEQVAADLGAAEVRQQPGNLSEQVQVHVVVGADRG
jgi:hypothetical protein